MVDVGAKGETNREAVGSAAVRMSPATLALAVGGGGSAPKGDVLATARVAAIAALKRTSDLIPLCHPVRLVGSAVEIERDDALPGLRVRVTARAFDRTGVEMEALVGAAAAALTIYDMVKGVERGVEIVHVRLEEKRGGRSGEWRRGAAEEAAGITPHPMPMPMPMPMPVPMPVPMPGRGGRRGRVGRRGR
jgi:cyclic pyranopterin phosphate synthase